MSADSNYIFVARNKLLVKAIIDASITNASATVTKAGQNFDDTMEANAARLDDGYRYREAGTGSPTGLTPVTGATFTESGPFASDEDNVGYDIFRDQYRIRFDDGGTYLRICEHEGFIIVAARTNSGSGLGLVHSYGYDGNRFENKDSFDIAGATVCEDVHAGLTGGSATEYIYAACGAAGIVALDTDASGNLSKVGNTLNTPDFARELFTDGSYLHVVDNSSIRSYTFDGTNFTLVDSQVHTNCEAVWSDGTYTYVVDRGGANTLTGYTMNAGAYEWSGFPAGSAPTIALTDGYDVWGDGTYIYVADGSGGLKAYSFDGTSFTLEGSVTMGGDVDGVHCYDGLIYAASANVLFVYKFDGSTFTKQHNDDYGFSSGSYGVFADSSGAYVARAGSGVTVLGYGLSAYSMDAAGAFTELEVLSVPMDASAIYTDGTFVYVGTRTEIRVYTFDGSAFTYKSAILAEANAALWHDGTYLYALGRNTTNNYRLQAFTVSAAGVLTALANTNALAGEDMGYDLTGDGTYLYVANGVDGLRVYTFDGVDFTQVDSVDAGNTYVGVHYYDGIIFCACGDGGIRMYKMLSGSLSLVQTKPTTDTLCYGIYANETGVWVGRQTTGLTLYGYGIYNQLLGQYQPIREQYILHDMENDKSYAYHIRYDAFYKFTGFDLESAMPRVLSAGTADENVNLLVWGDKSLYKYPGDSKTSETAYIITKAYDYIRAVFLRWKVLFSGGTVNVTTYVEDKGTEYTDTQNGITSDQWYWIVNGKNLGKHLYMKITGATSIFSSIFEYVRRGMGSR